VQVLDAAQVVAELGLADGAYEGRRIDGLAPDDRNSASPFCATHRSERPVVHAYTIVDPRLPWPVELAVYRRISPQLGSQTNSALRVDGSSDAFVPRAIVCTGGCVPFCASNT